MGRIAANPLFLTRQHPGCCSPAKNFGDEKQSAVVGYLLLRNLLIINFPGFEHENRRHEIIDGVYHVMCVKASITKSLFLRMAACPLSIAAKQ